MSTERRYDPLSGRWITLSAGRLNRPWQGEQTSQEPTHAPGTTATHPATAQRINAPDRDTPTSLDDHDAACFLCPGNTRASGAANPRYTEHYVFDNDYPALSANSDPQASHAHSLFRAMPVTGLCRVLCYTPRHSGSLGALSLEQIDAVIALWQGQWMELSTRCAWVQIFENRGTQMGASSPHPHGQLWATSYLPQEAATEELRQQAYYGEHGRTLLADYLTEELRRGERIVAANEHWVVVVPYWAVWPFETLVLPRQACRSFNDIDPPARASLAHMLQELIGRYDGLFNVPFPYSMGWHGRAADHWTLHAHFYPPLLRSASVRKHMVGFELLAEAQRDLSPEEAAARLRQV